VAEEAGSTRRGNDLTLPSLIATAVTLIEQLQERKDRIIQGRAVEAIGVVELVHWCLPSMLHKVRESVPRFQVLEHGPGHACVGDQDVDIADLVPYLGCNCFQVIL
jgi:hypothetical protein